MLSELQRPKDINSELPGRLSNRKCYLLVTMVQRNLSVGTLEIQGWELLGTSQNIWCVISSWWWEAALLCNVIQLSAVGTDKGVWLSSWPAWWVKETKDCLTPWLPLILSCLSAYHSPQAALLTEVFERADGSDGCHWCQCGGKLCLPASTFFIVKMYWN
jgi:hypothetical protein